MRLEEIHAEKSLDHILITGDVTDAGRSAEWAEFFSAMLKHPVLAARTLILPGNHDINVVDRSNPAKLDFPTSPGRRLREMRALSGICAVQGARTRVFDPVTRRLGKTLDQTLSAYTKDIATFADTGTLRLSMKLAQVWAEAFPVVLPPETEDGLGIIMLNSTALTHFSFTNALGLMSSEQSRAMHAVVRQFPKAQWIVALHHHLVEYPTRALALSERIGTALINGSWFVRQVQRIARRAIVMHGHRHIDWIGRCGRLVIVSAPSPVMEARDGDTTAFYIHTLGVDEKGRYLMARPERVEIAGAKPDSNSAG
jgi:3',5'-cyclic AMP phosphodiesterase CpdA